MASTLVSSIGQGTGLNITEMVAALVNADTAAKKAQITRQTSNNTAMISGVGSLRSALTAFQDAMAKLNSSTSPAFNAYAAKSANESVVKVTAGNTAVAGSYDIVVNKLATGSKVASAPIAGGAAATVTGGTLTIEQNGNTYELEVEDGASLQSVRDQINKELGVQGTTSRGVPASS